MTDLSPAKCKTASGAKSENIDFPKLKEKAHYSLKLEPAYMLNEFGLAEKIQNRRGLAQQILKNAETGEPISFHTPDYRPVTNMGCRALP